MRQFEITVEGDVHHVKGRVDEHADFAPLLAAQGSPLRISLEDVESLSSVGCKALAVFNKALGPREVEYLSVPVFLVDLINTMPALFGKKAKSVRSLLAPYHCAHCNQRSEQLVRTAEVRVTNLGVDAPARLCPRCSKALKLTMSADEYFLFLIE